MAEKIARNEYAFTEKMNQRAKELGANDTLFSNCTGLPQEPQYSCAKDVGIMMRALLKNKEYFEFGKVWLDKFAHPKGRYTEITNTNKLVRFYDGCDGGKTGFTNQAGFCLAATAKRNDMRVISVVIGEENSKQRFDDVRTTFDYAFANYELKTVIDCSAPLEKTVEAVGGKQKRVAVAPVRNVYAFVQRGTLPVIQVETNVTTSVKAPVEKGAEVGEIVVYKDGVETDRIAVVTMEESGCAGIFDKFRDVSDMWNLS
jgi:D-alanyl-D-alanine carboxypeptidase (penicillin-binding protein 5/6)